MQKEEKTGDFDLVNLENFPVPDCALFMRAQFIDYQPGESITFTFPVREEYLNPGQSMQGGFITAAFDNVFGPLSLLELKSTQTRTTTITTSYHRPVYMGDELKVTAFVKATGRKKMHMWAEAYNKEGKLVATATTDYIISVL